MSTDGARDVFLAGETVDLIAPDERAVEADGWHAWFNDPDVTRHLVNMGLFPNSRAQQREKLANLRQPGQNALVLLVLPKGGAGVIGVAHLKDIDFITRQAHFGLIMGSRERSGNAVFEGLETKALMVQHAFDTLGLERVWGEQCVELEAWQRYQVLFGFLPEGIHRGAFRKGQKRSDTVSTSCLVEEYQRIKALRNGAYWPGKKALLALMRDLPKESVVDAVDTAIRRANVRHMKKVRLA
ncbi:MAG: GNAT family N-acetyltransferase [Humidesulfovibrio sp.]|uniref:GNAT family N-acetyltransferase n=1 Tax=Humidesulfovibrio sp. TaxID=2910988 RepID=UPI0027F249E8|nr:GNAT family N-acetyltransferase [Humidesulfovibrio sp.]MDQ7834830.1 GNAT family N-acetyltransferase [Humidesulfovibrio sp.]